MKEKTKMLHIRLPESLIEKVENFVVENSFPGNPSAINFMINQFFNKKDQREFFNGVEKITSSSHVADSSAVSMSAISFEDQEKYKVEFNNVMAEYPKGSHVISIAKGRVAYFGWRQRNKDVHHRFIYRAVQLYRNECEANESIGTEYVTAFHNFFEKNRIDDYLSNLYLALERGEYATLQILYQELKNGTQL